MNAQNIGLIVSLLFPPLFVIAITFYEFDYVALVFTFLMLIYLIVSLILKHSLKHISTPLIYFFFVFMGYTLSSMEFIKMIPVMISGSFLALFLYSYIQKKNFILSMTQKFYKKELTERKKEFLAQSDLYWVFVLLINTSFQTALVFYDYNELWAFYSSVGWYIYLAFALVLQIVYEKIFIREKVETV